MTTFKKLVKGSTLSETQYYKVEKISGNKVQLRNDYNEPIVVEQEYVEKHLISADQFDKEVIMNKTEIVNLFLSSPNVVLAVNYNKQIDPNEAKKQIFNLYPNKGGKLLSESDFKKKVSDALADVLAGEERTMIGRHYSHKDEFGRVRFIDMNLTKDSSKDYDTRQRLVDPRTISWLILKGIKYTLK